MNDYTTVLALSSALHATTRIAIVEELLNHGELSISALADTLTLKLAEVSHHVMKLRFMTVVDVKTVGRSNIVSLRTEWVSMMAMVLQRAAGIQATAEEGSEEDGIH
jgi:DNA-binding transcriptional ArsR family regulator